MSEEQAQQKTYLLTLYISGMCPHSSAALDNIQCLCAGELKGQVELEVVDIRSNPEALIRERILAIPTLIKRLPLPVRRLIGDLGDKERLLKALGVKIDPAGGGGGARPQPMARTGPLTSPGGLGNFSSQTHRPAAAGAEAGIAAAGAPGADWGDRAQAPGAPGWAGWP